MHPRKRPTDSDIYAAGVTAGGGRLVQVPLVGYLIYRLRLRRRLRWLAREWAR